MVHLLRMPDPVDNPPDYDAGERSVMAIEPRRRKERKRLRDKILAKRKPKPSTRPVEVEAAPMSQFDTPRCPACHQVLMARQGKHGPGVFCGCVPVD